MRARLSILCHDWSSGDEDRPDDQCWTNRFRHEDGQTVRFQYTKLYVFATTVLD